MLPSDVLERVDERFRAPGKRWVGMSGRARVIAYNTDELTAAASLPDVDLGLHAARVEGQDRPRRRPTRPSRRS